MDATTGAVTGYNGRMTAPQDQTSTPPQDDVVVAAGDTLPCAVEIATDQDKRTETINGVTTTTYPSDGAATYKWTATDSSGVPAGSFDTDTATSATWTAPQFAGTYTLKCALDDPWTRTQTGVLPNEGDRNDKAADGGAPVIRSVQVTVVNVEIQINMSAADTTPDDATDDLARVKSIVPDRHFVTPVPRALERNLCRFGESRLEKPR